MSALVWHVLHIVLSDPLKSKIIEQEISGSQKSPFGLAAVPGLKPHLHNCGIYLQFVDINSHSDLAVRIQATGNQIFQKYAFVTAVELFPETALADIIAKRNKNKITLPRTKDSSLAA